MRPTRAAFSPKVDHSLYFVLSWRLIRLDFPAAMTLPP